jgi:hypothetical protein
VLCLLAALIGLALGRHETARHTTRQESARHAA